ncbi:MAG: DUF885 domain-containing protein [Chromatiales bacterium]
MRTKLSYWIALVLVAVTCAMPVMAATEGSWVARSNAHTQLVLEFLAKYNPEGAASLGVDGLDEQIFDLGENIHQRQMEEAGVLVAELKARLIDETDPKVRQDLQILIKAGEDYIYSSQLEYDNLLPYLNMPQTIFYGMRGLLDPQVDAARQPAAVVRLRKYAGLEEGYEPITELAKARTAERFDTPGLIGPYKGEIEQELGNAQSYVSGIEQLFQQYGLEGWEEPYQEIVRQLADYDKWVRAEVLPRARDDYRLPAVLYEDALRNWGVYESPQQLIQTATQGYMDIRNEMDALAPLIAKQKGYDTSDYREVIRLLKKERIAGDELLDYYNARLKDLEKIIRDNRLVSLPDRDAGIRIASEAETAAQPAAHLETPRLIGNTGEFPVFVLPKLGKNADGSWQQSDDNFEAGTWTLTAHEARPGHELQYSAMIEEGVSIARAVFSFNSANVEGWALYAEAIAKPYLPLDAQMISLQYRLARAARMFLDPMLNLGLITPEDARRVLLEDVVLGETWAQNEVERYTYRMPGQATAYYYGYTKLQALRTQTELMLKDDFDALAFHDFILAQGLLPPELLREAVTTEFVPSQRNAAGKTAARR